MPEPRDGDERIVRYIAGECAPFEAVRIQQWIAADPALWERFQALERAWRMCMEDPARRWNVDAACTTLRRSRLNAAPLHAGEHEPAHERTMPLSLWTRTHERWTPGWVGVPAALALALALTIAASGALGWRVLLGRAPAHETVVPLQEVATARGQRATITLADGTRIVLGAASSIRYPRDFGTGTRRDVYLDGQAYFEVVHDTLHPFRVYTERGVAEDLGTEFVVTAYSATPGMQVVVASGEVALRYAGASLADSGIGQRRAGVPGFTLGPGELGSIDSAGKITTSRVADVSLYLAWTRGRLVFRGVPLRDALPSISRWYDVDIVLGDSVLAGRRLVAEFGAHSAHEVVRLIALAVDARYEQRGDTIVLLPRRGQAH